MSGFDDLDDLGGMNDLSGLELAEAPKPKPAPKTTAARRKRKPTLEESINGWEITKRADFGEAPSFLLFAAPYALTVVFRRQQLRRDKKTLEGKRAAQAKITDEALLPLGKRLMAARYQLEKFAALKGELEAIELEESKAKVKAKQIEQANAISFHEREELQRKVALQQGKLEPLQANADVLTAALNELQSELDRRDASVAEFKEQLTTVSDDNRFQCETGLAGAQAEQAHQRDLVADKKSELAPVKTEIESVTRTLTKAERALQRLEKNMAQPLAELERIRAASEAALEKLAIKLADKGSRRSHRTPQSRRGRPGETSTGRPLSVGPRHQATRTRPCRVRRPSVQRRHGHPRGGNDSDSGRRALLALSLSPAAWLVSLDISAVPVPIASRRCVVHVLTEDTVRAGTLSHLLSRVQRLLRHASREPQQVWSVTRFDEMGTKHAKCAAEDWPRMRRPSIETIVLTLGCGALGYGLLGCTGGLTQSAPGGTEEGSGGVGSTPAAVCPVDPDCGWSNGDDCSEYECPDFWTCQDLASGGKRCTSVGPDYPDDGRDWDCEDSGGATVCRRNGDFPDGGGGGDWNCQRQGEFVVCSNGAPDLPDDGAGGPWNCLFDGDLRICESGNGDGGGWNCYDTESGQQCRRANPESPDERDWECFDADGGTSCRTAGNELPDDGGGGTWDCRSNNEFVICRDSTPDYPDGGNGGPWDCYFAEEFRVCDSDSPMNPPMEPTNPRPDRPGECVERCVPGQTRYCDEPTFCFWGTQICAPDGSWGACTETRDIPAACDRGDSFWGRQYDPECCVEQGQCCQNFGYDRSLDRDASIGMCADIVEVSCN